MPTSWLVVGWVLAVVGSLIAWVVIVSAVTNAVARRRARRRHGRTSAVVPRQSVRPKAGARR